MLKTRFPFLSACLATKTWTIASNVILKAVGWFVVLHLSTFSGFSIFAAGFSFAFGNFAHYCVVLLNAPLNGRVKKKQKKTNKKKRVCNVQPVLNSHPANPMGERLIQVRLYYFSSRLRCWSTAAQPQHFAAFRTLRCCLMLPLYNPFKHNAESNF